MFLRNVGTQLPTSPHGVTVHKKNNERNPKSQTRISKNVLTTFTLKMVPAMFAETLEGLEQTM
jgi:hypothetical protein